MAALYPPGRTPAYEGRNALCKILRVFRPILPLRQYEFTGDVDIKRRLDRQEKFMNETKATCQRVLGKGQMWYAQAVATHPHMQVL